MSSADAAQRATALDPLRSFCVTAPAGSGKTELLIQRYLRLLARVVRPEQVIAITFTRKAAAEMRARVLDALAAAERDDPVASEHQQTTRALAEQALAADASGNWRLARDVSRLNIKTIDSFCASLTRQMPVMSQLGGQAKVTDDAAPLYAEAVQDLFSLLDQDHPLGVDLRAVLAHFDNNWQRVQELFQQLLRRRDQWGEYVGVRHQPDEAEAWLLQTVHAVVEEELGALAATLAPVADELLALQRYAAAQLGEHELIHFPAAVPEDLGSWRQFRKLLLTAQGEWRKTVDKRAGFPPDGAAGKARKQQLYELIGQLQSAPGALSALTAIDTLPETGSAGTSWQLALHLSHLLPRLAAELLLVFSRRGLVDHSQVALSALQALGDDEAPTELALRLDYQIEHILVDEFQDTAINQFELVRRLTRGWGMHNAENPLAPRTIMIVGDGMQSIYGFRDANVGLFLKAREEGFNGVTLTPLSLRCNFRSDEGIVDWVNQTFAWAFPRVDDSRRGQVSFTDAVPVKPEDLLPAVIMHGFSGDTAQTQEVACLCEQIERGIESSECTSIAVLGRSRSQLQAVLAEFKRRGIPWSAQDMDTLADSPAVVDLLSLCRALLNPADRVAWLALLRAPWCGLELADLHRVAGCGLPIAQALVSADILAQLSTAGQQRLARLSAAVQVAQRSRDRLGLRVWLEQLWLTLAGPATLAEVTELEDAERFFQLLEIAEQDGVGLDLSWMQRKLEKVKLSREQPDSKVQVMTLHKAKGLEFDWVFIPGMARLTRGDNRQLLLWDDYTNATGERGFLLAADDHSSPGEPTLYNYLQRQRKVKSQLETTRLLYVGATRAIKHLVLSACLNHDEKKDGWKMPPRNSLLKPVWDTFEQQMQVHASAAAGPPAQEQARRLRRLLLATELPAVVAAAGDDDGDGDGDGNIPLRSLNRVQRHAGTVLHQVLEDLSRKPSLPTEINAADRQRWQMALRRLGLAGPALTQALSLVVQSTQLTLADTRGRWLLDSGHEQAHSEWSLTWSDSTGTVRDVIIDRSFIDRDTGERWIIDYKTSQPEAGEALAEFVTRECEDYRGQLQGYRDAVLAAGPQPLRCALYFTAVAEFAELNDLYSPARE